MPDLRPGQHFDFEQIDADAVCEQCGTVNPEATLICKICGNNLRDQRLRRIAAQPAGAPQTPGVSRFRLFTTLLTTLGVLVVVAAALNVDSIAQWVVGSGNEESSRLGDVWSGADAEIYNELDRQLTENPITRAEEQEAIANPVIDTVYDGRYILMRPNAFSGTETIGEAILQRRAERVYFVAKINFREMQVRGFAILTGDEGGNLRPVVQSTASAHIGGGEYLGWGYGVPNADGSHTWYAQSTFDDNSYGILAYRIR